MVFRKCLNTLPTCVLNFLSVEHVLKFFEKFIYLESQMNAKCSLLYPTFYILHIVSVEIKTPFYFLEWYSLQGERIQIWWRLREKFLAPHPTKSIKCNVILCNKLKKWSSLWRHKQGALKNHLGGPVFRLTSARQATDVYLIYPLKNKIIHCSLVIKLG